MSAAQAAKIPKLIYGTAWKKTLTRQLVKAAILAGFRGIDTAAQPKHYQEDLVGQGIRDGMKDAGISRHELYIQTKYTSIGGQDPDNMPYNPRASITDQVKASIASSLHNLRHAESDTPYLDCLVLHSPFPDPIQTAEAWQAMEFHVPHSARTLGISNIYSLPLLEALYRAARVKPSVVQNRFYADSLYDQDVRAFCEAQGITYQSFWTLTANPHLEASEVVGTLAKNTGVSRAVALYSLVLGLGRVSVLDGTTKLERLKADVDGVGKVAAWRASHHDGWQQAASAFEALLHQHGAE